MQVLTDRVAVLTGAASGIGRALAERLASEGMKLVLADVEAEALAATVDGLRADGAEVLGVPTDVSSADAIEALADAAWRRFGGVQLVCANAGVMQPLGPAWERPLDDFEWVFGVNLWGPIHCVRSFVPRMLEAGQPGHVLATASFAGLVPNFGLGAYCVSKYGVVALMECLARELRDTPLGASVLCPMMVATNIGANTQRDRPGPKGLAEGGELLGSEFSDASPQGPSGGLLDADVVAARVLDAIRDDAALGELYTMRA